MKNYFYGLLTGIVIVSLVGIMLFDNFKTKLRVAQLDNILARIIQANQQQQTQQIRPQPTP